MKATAVGKAPRYAAPSSAEVGAPWASRTRSPANGSVTTVPTTQPSQVARYASMLRSVTFCMITEEA